MRSAEITRKTKETDINMKLNIDGSGNISISTGIGFFDHMLTAFSKHAGFDLDLVVQGDIAVDGHHTVEDVGIVLGEAISRAMGDKRGIERFADIFLPMDETMAFCAIDISGRGFLDYTANFECQFCGEYECRLTEEFMRAFAMNAGITLHIREMYGKNDHHKVEAMYKALAVCLKRALRVGGNDVPSSKGVLG